MALPLTTSGIVSAPFVLVGADMTYSTRGRLILYQPHSYYVGMYSPSKRADIRELQIKEFALRNFYELKAGNAEYMNSLTILTLLPQ